MLPLFEQLFFNIENTLKNYICSSSLKMKVESGRVTISLSYENTSISLCKEVIANVKSGSPSGM